MQKISMFFKFNLEKIVFFIFLFLFIFAISTKSIFYDLDLWARLIVGKAFWQGGIILKKDFLSYIPTNIWYDHEWGSGVIFYAFYKMFSVHGFLILHIFLAFFTFFFVYKTLTLNKIKNPNLIFFIFMISAFLNTNYSVVRCQSITFLLFSIYIYILECSRNGKRKYLWITPILMLFWCNLHGGCISGIGLFVIYILGEFLSKKNFKYLIIPFILNIIVLPINPWGVDYLKFLYYANTLDRIWITEWYGLFDNGLIKKYFFIQSLIIFSCFAEIYYILKSNKRDWTKIILTLTTIILGINHRKHLPFAVIIISIFFYKEIIGFFKNLFCKIKNQKVIKYTNMLIYASILAFIIYSLIEFDYQPISNKYSPYKSVEFIKINNLKGNLLCDFSTGSFLEYKLYPQNKIYMDGRYEEVFKFEHLRLLMNFLLGKQDFNILLNKYPADIILIKDSYAVFKKLIESKEWTSIFYENGYVTLVKTKDLKNNYIQPTDDIEYYKKTLFDTDINFMIKSKRNEKK